MTTLTTYNTLWSENTAGWTPTSYPTGYTGPIITLYVKIYEDGCSLFSTATLSLEWETCVDQDSYIVVAENVTVGSYVSTTGQVGGTLIIVDNP